MIALSCCCLNILIDPEHECSELEFWKLMLE